MINRFNIIMKSQALIILLLLTGQLAIGQIEQEKNTQEKQEDTTTEVNQHTDTDKVYKVVESMPRFPGCEDLDGSIKEKEKCAQGKMMQYLYKNLRYPSEARKKGIDGMVILTFVVNKEGRIEDASILRDIGEGCGEAALAVIKSMNQLDDPWVPGVQRGQNVKVMYSLPVNFKLEKGKDKEKK